VATKKTEAAKVELGTREKLLTAIKELDDQAIEALAPVFMDHIQRKSPIPNLQKTYEQVIDAGANFLIGLQEFLHSGEQTTKESDSTKDK